MAGGSLLRRIAPEIGGEAVVRALAEGLAPRDLESLMLHVYATRSARREARELLDQYATDAATQQGIGAARLLHRFEHEAYEAAARFEMLALPPVLPLGSAARLARQHQNNVLSATRKLELLSDPTLALALHAAQRRRAARDRAETLRLGAHARVLRMQPLEVKGLLPHFMLFALASAGREVGGGAFVRQTLLEHIEVHLRLFERLSGCGFAFRDVRVELSDTVTVRELLSRAGIDLEHVRERVKAHRFGSAREFLAEHGLELPRGRLAALGDLGLPERLTRRVAALDAEVLEPLSQTFPGVEFALDFSRLEGLGYYQGPCLRISAENVAGERFPLSDGGSLDWLARLASDERESFVATGLGPDLVCARYFQGESA